MAGSLACHVFGCTDPVVDQCKGYKEPCGRYFCKQHSPESLCLRCYDKMWEAALASIQYAQPGSSTNS